MDSWSFWSTADLNRWLTKWRTSKFQGPPIDSKSNSPRDDQRSESASLALIEKKLFSALAAMSLWNLTTCNQGMFRPLRSEAESPFVPAGWSGCFKVLTFSLHFRRWNLSNIKYRLITRHFHLFYWCKIQPPVLKNQERSCFIRRVLLEYISVILSHPPLSAVSFSSFSNQGFLQSWYAALFSSKSSHLRYEFLVQ